MENSIIRVENLSVCYNDDKEGIRAVNNVSFNLDKGSSLGIIGESGSGKTSIAMALMGLLKKSVTIDGKVYYGNTDLNSLLQKDLKPYRWAKIAIVFQNSLDVLNPVLTVHEQILECIQRHIGITGQQAHKKVVQLLEMVGLDSLRT